MDIYPFKKSLHCQVLSLLTQSIATGEDEVLTYTVGMYRNDSDNRPLSLASLLDGHSKTAVNQPGRYAGR
jgi:hypothetical protein